MIPRPPHSEFTDYQLKYADKVVKDPFLQLDDQCREIEKIIDSLDDEKLAYRYADGKWSVKEVLIHLMDTEQIFAFRALAISRGEKQNLPSFDHNAYVEDNNFDHISKEDLMRELCHVRDASVSLFRTFSQEQLEKEGKASGNKTTPRALLYMMTGHTAHHLEILKERYLK